MAFEPALFYGMFNNLAIFIVMVFIYGLFIDAYGSAHDLKGRVLLGLWFGLIAFVSMQARIPAGEGVIVDQRNAIVTLSAAFGGPIPAVITAFIAGAYRVYLGGAGVISGIAGVTLSVIAGSIMYALRIPTRNVATIAIASLATTAFIMVGFLFYKSLGIGFALLKEVALPFGTAIFLGIFLGTLMLAREKRRHDAEAALRISEDRFRVFAQSASDWFWETDAQDRLVFASAGDQERDVLPIGEELGDGNDETAIYRRRFLEALKTRQVFRGVIFRYRRADGDQRFVTLNGQPMFDADGRFEGYRGTAVDATDSVRAEIQLKEREVRYRSVIATAQDGFWVADMEGRILEVNDAYVARSGYSRDELLAMRVSDISVSETAEGVAERIARLARKGSDFFTTKHKTKSGEIWDAEVSASHVDYEGGRIFAFHRDISLRKSMERQLIEAQKMEAIGQLSGGVAHDFNNLLNVVSMNASLLEAMVAKDPPAVKLVNAILAAVMRGAELTHKMLGFARTKTADAKRVSANDIVIDMKGLLARSLTPSVHIETKLAEDLWQVHINRGDLADSILNLALNARDAMPQGGILAIESANRTFDEDRGPIIGGTRAGDFVMIAVTDTGHGMPRETVAKIFEPFFTTKEVGKGTGLGLSMVYGLVQRSNGFIEVDSEVGRGTVIRLFLPRAEESPATEDSTTREPAELPNGGETILILDDEGPLAEATAQVLGNLGYATITATSAARASAILDERRDIDLLFSDIIMPGGTNGFQFACREVKKRPDLKILLTTGFADWRETPPGENVPPDALFKENILQKPYSVPELAAAIRRAMDAPPGAHAGNSIGPDVDQALAAATAPIPRS